jgi:four helix bundle protein
MRKVRTESSAETVFLCGRSVAWWDEDAGDGTSILNDEGSGARGVYDLMERVSRFGEDVVRFSKRIPRNSTTNRLIDQIVGASTSVGANYCEADENVSKKDFRFSISRCKKESKETRFFLRMIVAAEPQLADEARTLYREATELLRIFSAIYRK